MPEDVIPVEKAQCTDDRRARPCSGLFALMSFPGSGKTTLLCETIRRLKTEDGKLPIGVLEGDQQTAHDADRIRATGVPAVQVNTGKGCHLDGHMVGHAADHLGLLAAIVGEVLSGESVVVMTTPFGGERVVDMLVGDQLPRIC